MDDLNKPETEEDSKLAWERRRYRTLQSSKGQPVLTPALLTSDYRPMSAQEEHDQENEDQQIQQEVLKGLKQR